MGLDVICNVLTLEMHIGYDFFAATNGLHWIQCECSHCTAVTAVVGVVPQKMGLEPIFVQQWQWHHESSPDSGTSKSLNFSIFWTF